MTSNLVRMPVEIAHNNCSTRNGAFLYIHIPYCRNICDYCSFTVSRGNEVPDDYIKAIFSEWETQYSNSINQLHSIYLGGGTPSLLSNQQIEKILNKLQKHIAPQTEITIEANPTSSLPAKIKFWKQIGINRISLGIQSLNRRTLKKLTRTHNEKLALRVLHSIHEQGFKNTNVDLMFGVDGQTVEEFTLGLKELLSFNPSHLSAYELTIEPGTPFDRNNEKQGPEDDVIKMLDVLIEECHAHGINRYEISNFARAGHESIHNKNYWMNREYIGLGCGAWSFYNRRRSENLKTPDLYLKTVFSKKFEKNFQEKLDDESFIKESIMTRLRMIEGISRKEFIHEYNVDAYETVQSSADPFIKSDYLYLDENQFKFTSKGIKVANTILKELI